METDGCDLEAEFAEAMGTLLGPDFPADIALAVSGGGDSMAMLTLAHNWTRKWGVRLWIVTVDHGLRAESAAEAAFVAKEAADLGHPHAILRWHWDGKGNLQDAARRGRLQVIDRWRGGMEHVLFAHTKDDLAETFLMRLKRGSGVEGLSAMQGCVHIEPHLGTKTDLPAMDVCWTGMPPNPKRRIASVPAFSSGFKVIRPCLGMSRTELRHYLRTLKGNWVEDPSNDNPRFERVRMRQAMGTLSDLGFDIATLAGTADRMARAKVALTARAVQVWKEIGQEDWIRELDGQKVLIPTGDLLFDRDGFEAVERDTQLRLLAAALGYVSGAQYRPRAAALEIVLDRLLGGGGGTLQGCELRMERDNCRVFREFEAVRQVTLPHGSHEKWDNRWKIWVSKYREDAGIEIRALGDQGWRQVDKPPKGAPRYQTARALPALWQGEKLLACDALGVGDRPSTRLFPSGKEMNTFTAFLLSH